MLSHSCHDVRYVRGYDGSVLYLSTKGIGGSRTRFTYLEIFPFDSSGHLYTLPIESEGSTVLSSSDLPFLVQRFGIQQHGVQVNEPPRWLHFRLAQLIYALNIEKRSTLTDFSFYQGGWLAVHGVVAPALNQISLCEVHFAVQTKQISVLETNGEKNRFLESSPCRD